MHQPNVRCSLVTIGTDLVGISLIVDRDDEAMLFCNSFLLNKKNGSGNQINITMDDTVITLVNHDGLEVKYLIKKDMALLLSSFINPDTNNILDYVLGTIDYSDRFGYMITYIEIKGFDTVKLFPLLQIPVTEQ